MNLIVHGWSWVYDWVIMGVWLCNFPQTSTLCIELCSEALPPWAPLLAKFCQNWSEISIGNHWKSSKHPWTWGIIPQPSWLILISHHFQTSELEEVIKYMEALEAQGDEGETSQFETTIPAVSELSTDQTSSDMVVRPRSQCHLQWSGDAGNRMGLVEIKTRKGKSVSSCLMISQETSQEKYCTE